MAFMCPPKDESEGRTKLLNDFRNVFDQVEKKLTVSAKPICVPVCLPVCDLPCVPCPWQKNANNLSKESTKPVSVPNPPDVMAPPNMGRYNTSRSVPAGCRTYGKKENVCYKVCQRNSRAEESSNNGKEVHRVRQSKSRELRASILYRGCDCEKRFGLQDDCPRTGCHGSPECLTNPPTCGPSEFCDGKHLGKMYSTSKRGRKGSNGGNGKGDNFKAKYKCFPAVVNDPVCCCPCP